MLRFLFLRLVLHPLSSRPATFHASFGPALFLTLSAHIENNGGHM